jgi:formylglycine-generating enzyme required for sulfatase activity
LEEIKPTNLFRFLLAKYALLVGVDAYGDGLPLAPVTPVCALDALRDALRRRDVGGFRDVCILRNPDRARLSRRLAEWCASLGRGDMLLLYIAAAGRLDAAGRAHLLLPGGSGTLHSEYALPLAAVTNSLRLSACTRRVLLLDVGFVGPSGAGAPASDALACERMTVADTGVLASAAGAPYPASGDAMPSRRLLGPRLTELLTTADPDAPRVVTLNALYEQLRRDTPPGERRDVPRLWLGHVHRGALALARNPAAPRPAPPVLPQRPSQSAAVGSARVRARRLGAAPAKGGYPRRRRSGSSAGPAERRRKGSRPSRGTVLLRVTTRFAGLALLGPLAFFLAAEDASTDLQVAAAKLLHRAAPGAFSQLFVDGAGAVFSDRLRSGGRGPVLAALPGGFFMMGSTAGEPERHASEGPVRRVGVGPFALGIAEVSFAEYDRFAQATGRSLPADGGWGRGNRPVINVSWDDAVAYIRWLSAETGRRYFLPTEAQWEFAARAATETPFATGGCIHTDQANYNGAFDYADCGARTGIFRGQTLPATALPPNRWGLYHTAGNVWEWVADCWEPNHAGVAGLAESAGEAEQGAARGCGRRVIRGGGWRFEPGYLRSSARIWSPPATRNSDIGFRIARALD